MTVALEVGAEHLTMPDVSPPDLGSVARETEVVVKETPLGIKDGDPPPLAADQLDEGRAVCDAVYRAGKETALVREARARGVRAVTGKRMLLYQCVLAQRLRTGRKPNAKAMEPSPERLASRFRAGI
jgi:shikimate 5-dehydrogenase